MRRRHSAALVAVTALVAAACSGNTSGDTTSTTGAPTTTLAPAIVETVWRFQSPDLEENRGFMLDVATDFPAMPGRPGLVAVGLVSVDDAEVPALWSSRNGSSWERIDLADTEYDLPGRIRTVERTDTGYVAAGSSAGVAAVWSSPDGETWALVDDGDIAPEPSDPDIADLPSEIIALSTTPDRSLVAVGAVGDAPAVWTSPDGAAWDRVPPDPVVFAGGAQVMLGVATGATRTVAVGLDGPSGAIWYADDPATWSRVPDDDALFGNTIVWDVVTGGPGWVAVGTAPTPEGDILGAVVWLSEDGATWERVEGQETLEGRRSMQSIVALGDTLYAAGSTFNEEGRSSATVWESEDGRTWDLVDADVFDGEIVVGEIASITTFGEDLTAVGRTGAFLGVWRTEVIIRPADG